MMPTEPNDHLPLNQGIEPLNDDRTHSQTRLKEFRQTHHSSPDIVLVGDDVLLGFGGGMDGSPIRPAWAEHTGACTVLNLGVAMDRVADLAWRIGEGLLTGLSPRVVILHVGLHDLPGQTNEENICVQLQGIIQAIRRVCFLSHLIVIDTVPGHGHDHRALHQALGNARLTDDPYIHRIETIGDFVNVDGSLKVIGVTKDDRYLDDIGFELIASRLGAQLQAILGRPSGRCHRQKPTTTLRIVSEYPHPVIQEGHANARDIAYGLEGGMVVKENGIYHLITAEMYADIRNNSMRLAHWMSDDRITWRRQSTIATSSGDLAGQDTRAALWGPMPIYDEVDERWNLFYVSYRACTRPEGLDGRIWRAVSANPGRPGIIGPWHDVGVIMSPGPESQAWEGIQGVDSFFPYWVGGRWLAFYGSSDIRSWFRVGLAESPHLSGPWERVPGINPVPLCGPRGTENPIVNQLPDGRWLAMFESVFNERGFGYATSDDGITWSDAAELEVHASNSALRKVRTPLGLIPEEDGSWTIFYTGFAKWANEWGQLWQIRVVLEG
jgi:hypothetical protein